jgi:hypothetical protein
MNNIVLVHGSFVDGSGWEGVYGVLTRHGYSVSIVQNPTILLHRQGAYHRGGRGSVGSVPGEPFTLALPCRDARPQYMHEIFGNPAHAMENRLISPSRRYTLARARRNTEPAGSFL